MLCHSDVTFWSEDQAFYSRRSFGWDSSCTRSACRATSSKTGDNVSEPSLSCCSGEYLWNKMGRNGREQSSKNNSKYVFLSFCQSCLKVLMWREELEKVGLNVWRWTVSGTSWWKNHQETEFKEELKEWDVLHHYRQARAVLVREPPHREGGGEVPHKPWLTAEMFVSLSTRSIPNMATACQHKSNSSFNLPTLRRIHSTTCDFN